MPQQVEPDALHLAALERLERRFENLLRDLRTFRHSLESASKEKGVLGSRSLTEYVLGVLKSSESGRTITDLLLSAEVAGYSIPTKRTLSKRLTERAYRVQDIACEGSLWFWKGDGE